MKRWILVPRSLLHHLRSHVPTSLACGTACAVVTGAFLVGASVRESLRRRALERLGDVEWAMVTERFFRVELGADLDADPELSAKYRPAVPLIVVRGSVVHAETGRRSAAVNILGVDSRFAGIASPSPDTSTENAQLPAFRQGARVAAVNRQLASEVLAKPGDDILVSFETMGEVPREHALGKRRDTLGRLRLEVQDVLENRGAAIFDLHNQQETPRNVFVPLRLLQRALDAEGEVNTLLLASSRGHTDDAGPPDPLPRAALERAWRLDDVGLRLRVDEEHEYAALESREFLLPPEAVKAAPLAGAEVGARWCEVFTYLANTIKAGDREIPYSTVAAVGMWRGGDAAPAPPLEGTTEKQWAPRSAVLNSWAADDLEAALGDDLRLAYYVMGEQNELREEWAAFSVSAVVPLEGDARDPRWTPTYPGLSDARTFRDWDAPFEIDHTRIREPGPDGEYWRAYGTTPKLFVPLEDGQRLWGGRFGNLTSVRFRAAPGKSLVTTGDALANALRREIDPERMGLVLREERDAAVDAARRGTDFGGLFLALSSFIVGAALLLAAMAYRLSLERRAREIGTLSALGFDGSHIRRFLLEEGMLVAAAGTVVGLAGGVAYAAGLVAGLKSFWSGAVNAPFLSLYPDVASLAMGGGITLALVALTVYLVARRLAALRPRRLLRGAALLAESSGARKRSGPALSLTAGTTFLAGAGVMAGSAIAGLTDPVVTFFVVGGSILSGGLSLLAWALGRPRASSLGGRGLVSLARVGLRNARRAVSRSVVTAGLIACATFIVVTVAASRRETTSLDPERDSQNGGFAVMATSSVPILRPLDTPEGAEDLNLSDETADLLSKGGTCRVFALKLRPGDETSCLNLYRPRVPRILGAPPSFRARGGFLWSGSLAETEAERVNPWLLLEKEWPDGVVPAVGDASTVRWILHTALGEDLPITDDRGRKIRLRIVATLSHSIFQGDLLVPSESFPEHFPRRLGHSVFLVEVGGDEPLPPDRASEDGSGTRTETAARLISSMERDLAPFGVDARTTAEVLAKYQAVENTYLSTFFVLGGLGLLLGTLGMSAVVMRNVEERRSELALLRALGYSRGAIGLVVLSETIALFFVGVLVGAGAAIVAVLPPAIEAGGDISWLRVVGILLGLVMASGIGSSLLALRAALRTPLLPALRSE